RGSPRARARRDSRARSRGALRTPPRSPRGLRARRGRRAPRSPARRGGHRRARPRRAPRPRAGARARSGGRGGRPAGRRTRWGATLPGGRRAWDGRASCRACRGRRWAWRPSRRDISPDILPDKGKGPGGALARLMRRIHAGTGRVEGHGIMETTYKIIATDSGVPIKAWTVGVPLEDGAEKQLKNIASMPFVHKWVAVMPDAHQGMGATVGSVVATA